MCCSRAALLLPVLSAFGFIAMGRELATNAAAMRGGAMDHLSPANAPRSRSRWRSGGMGC